MTFATMRNSRWVTNSDFFEEREAKDIVINNVLTYTLINLGGHVRRIYCGY